MKIAHFSDTFFPTIGGVQIHIKSIVEGMNDCQFNIVTDALRGYPKVGSFSENCKVRRFGPMNIYMEYGNKIFYPQRVLATRMRFVNKIKWLNSSGQDLAHVHGPAIGMDLFKADCMINRNILSRKINFSTLNKKKLLTMHGLFSPYSKSRIYRVFENSLINNFETIICVDKSIYEYVKSVHEPDGVHFIPNSIDTNAFNLGNNNDNGPLNILYVGRPDALRGFDLVKELAKRLPERCILTLVLTDKPIGFSMPTTNNVRTFWDLNQTEVIKRISESDVVLNPLRIPVMSRVALEAMACKRPVITQRMVDNYPIKHDKNGFLFDGRIGSLTSLIEEIRDGRYDLAKMGEAAREEIVKSFDHKVIMPKIRSIYDSCMRG